MNLIVRPSKLKLWDAKHRIYLMRCNNGLLLYTCIFSHHTQRRSLSTTKAVASKHKQVDTAVKVTTAAESHRQALQVRTLDPRRLSTEDFVALDGYKVKSIVFPTAVEQPRRPVALLYLRRNTKERVSFPSDAQGFLYWHVEPDAPALASQLRFRITDSSDPATFPDGRDLHLPNGRVWNMNIFEIARNTTRSGIRMHLLAEKLVTTELLDVALAVSVRHAKRIVHPSAESVFIWKFGQTFQVDLGARAIFLWVLGRSGGKRLFIFLYGYSTDLVEGPGPVQYTGNALVQFERSTLEEHKGTRTVVLRMVKILELEKLENFVDIKSMPVPKEGSLMMKRGTHGAWSTWSVNVDKPRSRIQTTLSDVLSILFDNEEY
ncbi:hypothetical protein NEOLEDRAFT_1129692 [Neolentinus lepideus HHB14362 ss-1]|uniref:Uncharacterized protein n=1 Tax=Neolentinus lepideus HHB14362 ss-1 TaxID=1314782 RepID=A0A165UKG9_9AGAM|nr:hypothetical protein NEOLEDRAFT_1129692 [Neolentinus lepideus HHB14362 ss-1]